ncbi:uncharacterized protein LOC110701658 [Chenopodium quinoa]|uniref:uncharacterized protein LOC110701658 n=1 Tax=Chenopodium quinoa TaxID=63459 RepID=UPI000B77FFB0|nr:uncharacterized protein LOC110701658 [Chenopodium quinoa]
MGSKKRKMWKKGNVSEEGGSGHMKKIYPVIFKDDSLSVGGEVKRRGEVLIQHLKARCRLANTSYRLESFGRLCQKLDDQRKRWVGEMGFTGLLKIGVDMNLPRQLAYWLMTRIDPFNCTLTSRDGRVFPLSQNQVHWVLSIPNGGLPVPTNCSLDNEMSEKVKRIMENYGKTWNNKSIKTGREYIFKGISVNAELIGRIEGQWKEDQADEFKTVFLLLSLEMLFCPNQSSRLAADLVLALTCASKAVEYDWCSMVLKKLMDSVAMFAR